MTGRPVPPSRQASWKGFTLLELMITLAILAVLAAMSVWGFQSLRKTIYEKNFVTDLGSVLASGRLRAQARQRNVIFIFDLTNGANYYELDDTSDTFQPPSPIPPSLNTQAALATAAASFSKSATNFGLGSYSVLLIEEGHTTDAPVIATANAWGSGTTFPFPFQNLSTNTSTGCTFCTANRGALAFLPDGRVIFNVSNIPGGALVFGQSANQGTTEVTSANRKAVVISTTGHMEILTK